MFILNGQKATSTIVAVGGTGSIGIDDSVRGTLSIFGHGTGTVVGGYVDLYTNADHDTTINKYQIHTDSDDLWIGPDTNPDSLKYDGGLNDWVFEDTITALDEVTIDITAPVAGTTIGETIEVDVSGTLTDHTFLYGQSATVDAGFTNNGKFYAGISTYGQVNHTGGTALYLNGVFSYAYSTGGSAGYIFGLEGWAENDGGSVGTAYGTSHYIANTSGSMSIAIGTYSDIDGVIGTAYGLYADLDDVTGTKWGIYCTGDSKSHLDGNLNLGAGVAYLNFGGTDGTGGYGIRDASGIIEIKNSGGVWTPFGLESEKAWPFSTPAGASGTFWIGGYYNFAGSDDDFSPGAVTFGTANGSYAAHFFVVLGANAVDEITITISGTTIDDNGTRTGSDTATLVIASDSVVDDYFETPEKWIGQISIQVTAGTAKTCNYGFSKYWDNKNADFTVTGLEATWFGGATDASADIQLYHHKPTNWTFNSGAAPTPPTAIATMVGDHGAESSIINNENGAWKRTNLNTDVDGGDSEGTMIQVVTTQNRAIERGTFLLRIKNKTA